MSEIILPNFGGNSTATYATLASFPATADDGSLAVALDTDMLYTFNASGSAWVLIGPNGGSGGTVTSVAMTVPSFLTVSGSPVTSAGTLAVTLNTETAGTIFAGPTTGIAATPTFRAISTTDIPTLNQNTTGSAASFTGSLVGDVTGTQGATVVASVNGSTAAAVHSTVVEVAAAASINTPSTLVIRDSSGNFTAGTVTAALTGVASGNVLPSRLINTTSPLTGGGDLSADRTISIPQATASVNGYLASADFTTFNAKQPAGSYVTALTGDVTASGPGSSSATIAANAVTNAKLAQAPANTIKGNNTGSTANEADLTVSQVQTMLGVPVYSTFTAGSIPFSDGTTLLQDNTNLFYDATNKSLSVGPGPHPATSADLAISSQVGDTKVGLSVFSTSTNNAVQISNQNGFSLAALVASNTNSPAINFERARGTLAAKTQVLAGDTLGSFVFNGYTGSADGAFAAAFGAVATENQSSGHAGAKIVFQTTPNSSSTLVPRLIINQDGTIQIPGLTASRAVVTDGSSDLAVSATTSTEIGYVSGVTSAIQTQINSKQATGSYVTSLTGDVTANGPGSAVSQVNSVGGSTAASIHSAVVQVASATTFNVPSSLVMRDGSGNFSAGTITANLTGDVTGNVSGTAGSLITLTSAYTPTITGFGTVSNAKGSYIQLGDRLKLNIFFTAGTVSSTLASFSIPGAFTLSTSNGKLTVVNTTSQSGVKVGSYASNSASGTNFGDWYGAVVTAPATSTTLVYVGLSVTDRGNKLIPAAGNQVSETGSDFSFECDVILA